MGVPNVTARPSMINGQCTITVLLHDGRLIGGITVAIKGLTSVSETIRDIPELAEP